MRVAIIGPYPKPYGGISVHIRNLNLYYQKYYSNKFVLIIYNTVFHHKQVDSFPNVIRQPRPPKLINSLIRILNYNHRKKKLLLNFCSILNLTWYSIWLFKSLLIHRVKIIHFQGSASWDLRILTVIIAILTHSKSILSIHGPGVGKNLFQIPPLKILTPKQKFYWIFIKKYDHIICDNAYQIRNLRSLKYSRDKISFIKEFIPPIINNEDYKKIPKYIQNFYDKNEINILGMGWNVYKDGLNLYGLDMMLQLMIQINKRFPNNKIGLILKVIDKTKTPNFHQSEDALWKFKPLDILKQKINEENIQNILIIEEELSQFYPLIEKADIFLRPTLSDGDSVSVRESIYLNTLVIASNAIKRPKVCVLFKNRDQNDFNNKTFEIIEKILNNHNIEKNIINRKKNNAEKIFQLYKKLKKK